MCYKGPVQIHHRQKRSWRPRYQIYPVVGAWDERLFVYGVEGNSGVQELVFAGFNPAIRLRGLQRWGENENEQQLCGGGNGTNEPLLANTAQGKGKGDAMQEWRGLINT